MGPTLESLSATYSQDEDSAGRTGESIQTLAVEAVNAGGGCYFVIETERWAFDDIGDFEKLMKDFRGRAAELFETKQSNNKTNDLPEPLP